MANILKRFGDIMSANVNALLDRAENPEKMIDEYLRQLESDFGNVKAETVAVMAEETRIKRQLDENSDQIEKMENYAKKAVLAGNDQDAKQFLVKKGQLTETHQALLKSYELAQENSTKMKEMHGKLQEDIGSLQARRNTVKAKMAAAKTQETLNKVGSSTMKTGDTMSAFTRMEEKADRMLDEANARAELDQANAGDTIDDLTKKYDTTEGTSSIDDELAALKAQLNQ